MLTFERSFDYPLLNSLLRNPSLYPFIGDDFAPPIEQASVLEHEALWHILVRDEGQPLGYFLFFPDNGNQACWTFHTILPVRGKCCEAVRALLGTSGWLWQNAPCQRAVTFVPEYNRIALRCALRAGLQQYGRNLKSYLKSGLLQDQILLGISKE